MEICYGDDGEWMMTPSWIACLHIHISTALTACSSANVITEWFGNLPLISLSVSLMKHTHVLVSFVWELASVWMWMVGVLLLFKLTILEMAATAAPIRSAFFWTGFCIITRMGDSDHGAGSWDLRGVIKGMPIF